MLVEDLYRTHRRRLLAIARRNSNNSEDAEEALQEAFVSFITHFNPNNGAPPLAWLTLTLKRECWANRRRQNKHQTVDINSAEAGPEDLRRRADPKRGPSEMVELLDTFATARKQLAHLKPDQQKALSLFALGHSYREIAQITGWTYTKVNRCITEGRSSLRKLAQA